MSGVRCPVSGVSCQVSGVRCHVSDVSCQVFFVCFLDQVVELVGEGSVSTGPTPSSSDICYYIHTTLQAVTVKVLISIRIKEDPSTN